MNGPMSRVGRTAILATEQAPLYLECEILLVSGKVLGSETFRLVSFEGKEHVSEPFEFNLTLHGDTDPSADTLSFSQLIGRPVNVGIGIPDSPLAEGRNVYERRDAEGEKLPMSTFNGMVASFSMQEPGVYRLGMRPTLWRMTLTNNYRMHRQMNVRDVIGTLCREHRVLANFDGVGGADNMAITRSQDWLQAGESDYEFMRRLMGKAHIFFYFTHRYGQHVLNFANCANYPGVFNGERAMRYTWTSEEELALHQIDVISQYDFQQSMATTGVRGVFTTEENAANVDGRIASFASFRARSAPDVGELPFHQYRIYQYGGSNNEVRHYTLASHNALQTARSQLSGASFCPLFRVGHQFHMTSEGQPVRPELEKACFVLTEVTHRASLDGDYTNQFQACDARGLITPLTVADTQQGAVLAKVVAHRPLQSPGSWPYYTPDNFDMQEELLEDKHDVPRTVEAKGVYVRFSTEEDGGEMVWVKLAPYMQSVPEVGTMVMVSRANDESELPEIQNVQADGSLVVTPSDWTAHTQVGNSYSTSYGDGKSIRFGTRWSGADTDNAVAIVETAFGRKLFRDASYSRGASYSYSCSEDMEQGLLGENWSWGSSSGHSWAKLNKSFSATGRTYNESVTGSCDTTLNSTEDSEPDALAAVQASKSLVIGNTWSKSESRGDTKGVSTYSGTVTNDATHHGKVSSTTTINADSENTTTVTGTSTNTTTNAIVHNYTTTGVQSSSSAVGSSNSNDVVGVSNGNSLTGVRNQNSLTGAAIDASLQGSTNSASVTGVSIGLSVTGSSNSVGVVGENTAVNVTGSSTTINVTGESTSVDILGSGLSLSVKGATTSIDISGPSIQIPIIVMVM